MNIEEICKNLHKEKLNKDIMEFNYLKKEDYDICDFIINNTPNINYLSYRGKIIFKNQALNRSLEEFKIFNEKNYKRLLYILKQVKFKKDYPLYNCGVMSSFEFNINYNQKHISNIGNISIYHLPKKIHDIDIINIAHEHCHALKETNYKENINSLIIGEVIPIFYELINYEFDYLKEKHLEYRLFWLTEQKEIYSIFSKILNENINNHRLSFLNDNIDETINMYEYVKSYFGSYLGGFYYALILYNMYKLDPIKILNLVNDILSRKITTLDMLNILNIYCNIQENTFKKEINTIKKVLSK